MGLFSRMLGIEDDAERRPAAPREQERFAPPAAVNGDQQAIDRYHYMLRTAPPETIEQAHAEAFAKLSSEQRQKVLAELANAAPASEQASVAATPVDDPRALARVATRAEVRNPGVVERSLGGGAMGVGASLLSSFAMGFVGSMVAQSFFSALGGFGGDESGQGTADEAAGEDDIAENEAGSDDYSDDGGDIGGDFDV